MPCPAENLLLELASGTLDPEEAASLHEHIDSCTSCLHVVAELLRTDAGESSPYPARYKVIEESARGGQARVLRVFDNVTAREVAIKELLPSEEDAEGQRRRERARVRFVHEARLTARLTHPGIVPVFDIGFLEDGQPFYTMQFVRGRTLAQVLRSCSTLRDRLGLLSHFLDLCQAVSFAHHRGIVHRDIKPQNVVIGEFGQTVLVDWGLAKLADKARDLAVMNDEVPEPAAAAPAEPDGTVAGTVIGTPAYMSPEQAAGRLEDVDERSDVFGLGAVLYQILTGKPPLAGRRVTELLAAAREGRAAPVTELCPEVPRELAVIAHKALALDRAERYERAADLAADVQAFLTGGRVAAYEYSSWELLRRLVSRNKRVVTGAALGLLALIATLAALAVALGSADRERQRAEASGAEALLEGAQAALSANELLGTRAKLRTALEIADSLEARSMWWHLGQSPLRWRLFIGGTLDTLDASPTERILAVAGQLPGVRVIDLDTQAIRVLRGPDLSDAVWALRFSPDGRSLAAGFSSGRAWLWDLATSRARDLGSTPVALNLWRFSPDGRTLFAVSQDRKLWRWELGRGGAAAPQRVPTKTPVDMWGLAVSPDGQQLITATEEGELILRHLPTGNEKRLLCHPRSGITAAFSPDGAWLAAVGAQGRICLWPAGAAATSSPRVLPGPSPGTLSFSPDGCLLAVASHDGRLRIWDPAAGTLRRTLYEGQNIFARHPSWTSDGRAIAVIFLDGTVKLFSAAIEGTPALAPGAQAPGPHHEVAVSPDGKTIATASQDGRLRVHDRATGVELFSVQGHAAGTGGVAYSPDGRTLASIGTDALVRLWDAKSGRALRTLAGHTGTGSRVRFSEDGLTLASSAADGLRLWDVQSGGLRRVLGTNAGRRWDWHAGEIAAAHEGADLSLWDVESGRKTEPMLFPSHRIEGIAYHDGGRRLAILMRDGSLFSRDRGTRTLRLLGKVDCRQQECALAVDSQRQRLATFQSNSQIALWDPASGVRATIQGDVSSASFTPDGLALAGGDSDGTLRLWDIRTGRPLWRGPLLRSVSPEAYTHQGWVDLSGQRIAVDESQAWRRAVAAHGRLGAESPQGTLLCLATFDGALELWSPARDARLARTPQAGITRLVATERGCVVLAGQAASRIDLEGRVSVLAPKASAIAIGGNDILVGSEDRVLFLDATGSLRREHSVEPGLTALARVAEGLYVLGFEHGGVELWHKDRTQALRTRMKNTPHSSVVQVLAGPAGTVAAAFANGSIGVWSQASGRLLELSWLHGPVTHLRMHGHRLLALTEVGRLGAWDLETFSIPYCELLRAVWQNVPVIWEGGTPVLRGAPANHSCK